jgi:poly(3-hydroxybutyrate) depolymerase
MRTHGTLLVLLLAASPFVGGCPVFQPTDTPVPEGKEVEPTTGTAYWLYVPSTYTADRDWPLVITLHGTVPWDTYTAQILEWKALAEEKGFLVVCPHLASSQGIFPILSRPSWYEDLETDERVILAVLEDVRGKYRLAPDPNAVLLTGFSAGGFAMYHTGLRNASRFGMLIARACNGDVRMMEETIPLTDAARRMPIEVFWGKDESVLSRQGWEVFEYLRRHGFKKAKAQEVAGGHVRRPELAYRLWRKVLPARLAAPP